MPRLLPRARLAVAAGLTALALAACNGNGYDTSARAKQPLSPKTLALIEEKGMSPQSPILIRIYKQEAELEVWKETTTGQFALLKTYPICRWSGDLGPKVKVGDRQAPEGFYTITPGQMNPNSNYYLSFNLGFPNAYDRAYGRTGEFLMVHGDCSSAGCYALTDEQVAEVYALGREAFAGGQRTFQVQALPFRMTPANLAKYRNNPNMPFWKNLKEGVDAFDVTLREPKVNVCERRYVFNATTTAPRGFDADGPCPPYVVPQAIAEAVAAKDRADQAKVADLLPHMPAPVSRKGIDGGMHPVFLAYLRAQNSSTADGQAVRPAPPPGTMPANTTRPPQVAEDGFSPLGSPANTHVNASPALFASTAPSVADPLPAETIAAARSATATMEPAGQDRLQPQQTASLASSSGTAALLSNSAPIPETGGFSSR